MAKHTAMAEERAVTLNPGQRLYVIPVSHGGYSCLGFDVLVERYNRLAGELFDPALGAVTWQGSLPRQFPPELHGTLDGYAFYKALHALAARDGRRFTCELSPQLIGLEGHRVEVVTSDGETRRFIVGKSTGWIPIHLEIKRRTSHGGQGADRVYPSVKDLGRVR